MYRLTHKTISGISHDHLPDNQSVLVEINFRQRDRFRSDRFEIIHIIDYETFSFFAKIEACIRI